LCLIPNKFRKTVWIKRGNFVIVRETQSTTNNRKLRTLVENVLFPEHIKELKKQNVWPVVFSESSSDLDARDNVALGSESSSIMNEEEEVEDNDEKIDEFLVNPNHLGVFEESDDDD